MLDLLRVRPHVELPLLPWPHLGMVHMLCLGRNSLMMPTWASVAVMIFRNIGLVVDVGCTSVGSDAMPLAGLSPIRAPPEDYESSS